MDAIICLIAYGVLSATVIFLMIGETNKKLKQIIVNENDNEYQLVPYVLNWKTIVVSCILVGISAFTGYIICQNTVSVLANIKLGLCYLAVLSSSIIDLKTQTIPNYIPIALLGTRIILLVYEIIFSDDVLSQLISSLIGGTLCALVLIIANKISKGGIGGGDIKLLSCIGIMCGIYVVFSALLISLIVCTVTSIILLILKKKKLKGHTPFGPFIYIGFTLMCIFTLY